MKLCVSLCAALLMLGAGISNELLGVKPGKTTSASILEQFGKPQHDLENVQLVNVKGLRLLAYPDQQVSFYLKEDRVVFILVVPRGDGLPRSLAAYEKALGKPDASWVSVHGADIDLVVFAAHGVAVHARGDDVQTVELFEPTDLDSYRARFYKEPPPRHDVPL